MSDVFTVFLMLTLVFFVVSLVFIVFIIFHNKKMLQHKNKINEMEMARIRQDLRDSIEIQEKDLAKLGADLHDELGPTLSAVKLKINSLPTGQAIQTDELQQLKSMIDHTIYNVRTLSHALYPNALKQFGIADAVRDLIKRLSSLATVTFTSNVDPEANTLDYNVQLSFYRIIQEFFNNSLKHSDCTAITLDLHLTNDTVQLKLTDNGKGFDLTPEMQAGLGMKNMRMRAESIDATFLMQAEKNKGTILQVSRQRHATNTSSHTG